MKATFDFKGSTVLITGGSSGIGLAIAKGFRDSGGDVWITGTRKKKEEYPDDLASMTYRQLDMLDNNAVEALPNEMPSLNVLVNCAGTTIRNEEAYQPANFEKVIGINLSGAFRMSMAALPHLKKKPRQRNQYRVHDQLFRGARIAWLWS